MDEVTPYEFPYWILPDGLTNEDYKYYLEARRLVNERDEKGKGKLDYDSPELQGQRLYLFTPQHRDSSCQLPFMQSQERERWLISANRSGKTIVATHDVLSSAIGKHPYRQSPHSNVVKAPPLDIWIVSDTDQTSIEIVQYEIYKHMPEFSEFLESKNEYTRANGWKNDIITFKKPYRSVISFKNVKQGIGKFGGVNRDIVWIDTEDLNFKPIYRECQMRTASGGSIIVSYVPCHGYCWVYNDIYAKVEAGKLSGVAVFGSDIYSNKFIDRATVEQIEEGMPEHERQGRIRGIFSVPSGAVYDIFNPTVHGIEPERQVLPHALDGKWYLDIDFGWNHPFACILRWVDRDGRHCCIDEIKQSQLDSAKRAKRIIEMLERNNLIEWVCAKDGIGGEWKKGYVGITPIRVGICDPAEPLEIRELSKELQKQLGKIVKMIPAPRLRVEDGARMVYRLLVPVEWKDGKKLPRWFYWKGIDLKDGKPRCVELEREMATLHYKPGTDEIESINDDLCAANRYGIVACERGRRVGFYTSEREEK